MENINLEDDLPNEIIYNIAYKVPINSIPNLCRVDKKFHAICSDAKFWKRYIHGSQHKYHKLLVSVAKHDMFSLYKYLWDSYKLFGLIRERRSLASSFKKAYMAGYYKTANAIWSLDRDWIANKFYIYENMENIEIREMIKIRLNLIDAVKNSDTHKFSDIIDHWPDYSVPDMNREVFLEAISHSASGKYLYRLLKIIEKSNIPTKTGIYSIRMDNIFFTCLTKGNFELVGGIFDKNPDVVNEMIAEYLFSAALESKRGDSLEFIRQYYPDFDFPDDIQAIFGNKYEAIEYSKYVKDGSQHIFNLLLSFKPFKANDFMKLISNTVNCISRREFDIVIADIEREGHDYLATMMRKFPICDEDSDNDH